MTAPTQQPAPANGADSGGATTWFYLPAIVILVATMVLASQRDTATEQVSTEAAGEVDDGGDSSDGSDDVSDGSDTGGDDGADAGGDDQTGGEGDGDDGEVDEGDDDSDDADPNPEVPETRESTLSSPSYSQTFTVSSWDCTGDAGFLQVEGAAEGNFTLSVIVTDGVGTVAVDGGTEQDNITLGGTVDVLTKEPGAYSVTGTFGEPNLVGEAFTLAGTC